MLNLRTTFEEEEEEEWSNTMENCVFLYRDFQW